MTAAELILELFKQLDIMSLTILILLITFLVMFWRAAVQKRIDWTDVIVKPDKTVSLTKLIQLIGAIVATWIMVKLALTDKITWDIFAIYLAYVGSVEGFSKFVSAKYNLGQMGKDK